MPTTERSSLRVLVVDDNQDGADALGLLVEAFGNEVHVTYGGAQALGVATAFRPDLMLLDLAMPDMDGCLLAQRFRQIPAFALTKIVAITGHANQGHKTLAMKAGFDAVLFKPVALTEIEAVLAGVEAAATNRLPKPPSALRSPGTQRLLPIDEARRIRSQRRSKFLTEAESRAALCACFNRFQADFLGWKSGQIYAHFVKDLLIIRMLGKLTLAERQLAKASEPQKGRDLIKQVRRQLLEVARPMLESMVHEVAGVKVKSMHHDISTLTGEEVVLFSLTEAPRFETAG